MLENFDRLKTPLSKYIMLSSLLDRNEALYFRVVMDHADMMMPIIYADGRPRPAVRPHLPAAARAVHHRRRSRTHLAGHAQLAAPRDRDDRRHRRRAHPGARRPRCGRHGHPHRQAHAVHGRGGLHPGVPARHARRRDQQRVPARRPAVPRPPPARLDGDGYVEFVERLVNATRNFPHVLLQLEDFANNNAFRLLQRYRDRIAPSTTTSRARPRWPSPASCRRCASRARRCRNRRFLCLGAGEAATGISDLLVNAMVEEGVDEADARGRCWMVDSKDWWWRTVANSPSTSARTRACTRR